MLHFLAVAVVAVAPAEVSVTTLSNQQVSGTLAEFSSDGLLVVAGNEMKRFSSDELLRVAPQEPAKSTFQGDIQVQLVDGTLIQADSYEVANGKVMIGVADSVTVETRTREIRHVLLGPLDQQSDLQQQWQQVLDETLIGDTVVIRKVLGEPNGEKRIELRPVEGVLFDITADSVQFKFAGATREVPREKIEGLIYYHAAGRELPDAVCRVDDIHGSKWQASSIEYVNSDIRLETPAGVVHSLPLTHVRSFDFAQGKIVYLSDLTPAAVRWRPFYGFSSSTEFAAKLNEPQVDQSFIGSKLTLLDDQFRKLKFEKGLALRSQTSMLYILPDNYKRLVATVGLDPERGRSGNVRLQISGDGKTLLDEVVRGDQPAREIEVPITGVNRLSIVVDFGDNLTIGDYLHMCDVKVKK